MLLLPALDRFLTKYNKWLEISLLLLFCLLPLFLSYPYRVNIYLSWEGAYRLYLGQLPYRDFGMPTGYAYWLLPALFFKLFGPYMMSLVKAQVVLNIVSGLSLISILKSLKVKDGWRLALLFFFCLTYVLINFWPWYNQTVFVYQLLSLALLFRVLLRQTKYPILHYLAAGLFSVLSFLTKQDGGGLAIALNIALVTYYTVSSRNFKPALYFGFSLLIFGLALILPFIQYDFGYWFNYGQAPHYSRLNKGDILALLLKDSQWLKFYLILAFIAYAIRIKHWKNVLSHTQETLFFLLTAGIIVQAIIIQVTSYTPPDNNIYYHTFAISYLVYAFIQPYAAINWANLSLLTLGILFWWSGSYYKYINRVVNRIAPKEAVTNADPNKISLSTYVESYDTSRVGVNISQWKFLPGSQAFKGVYMPPETVAGIEDIKQLDAIKEGNPKVLNMSELTPLAHELGYELETGTPLWYHLGVSMFDRELAMFENRIENSYYDVVLFETIPLLNNFYPEPLRDLLKKEYKLHNRFLAPRPQNNAFIEVYIPKR